VECMPRKSGYPNYMRGRWLFAGWKNGRDFLSK